MCKRAKEKVAMRYAMLKLTGRVDGALTGLLLTYFFWGSFLLRCGDVESNPRAQPSSDTRKHEADETDQCRFWWS